MSVIYQKLKRLLPPSLRQFLSGINQRYFAKYTLRRKYGEWFDVEWRRKFATMSNEEWIDAYNKAWDHHRNDCVDETDSELIVSSLRSSPAKIKTVLEVGTGGGRLAAALALAGFEVTGIDVSTAAIAIAQSYFQEQNVTIPLRQGFAEDIPFPDKSFDALTCCHTLEHVKDLAQTVASMKRVARHCIVIVVPVQEFRLYADNYHTQFFTQPEQLVEAFGLERYIIKELDYLGRESQFRERAFLYVGYVG